MAWVETSSLNFTARHEARQSDAILSALEELEGYRTRLEALFPRTPGNVTIVLHDSPLQLAVAQPYLTVARRLASPASRRYMVSWFAQGEVHTLAPDVLRKLATGPGSLQALLLTPQRAYTLLVVAVNNQLLPPPFRPSTLRNAIRFAWLLEGAGQYFSGQLPHLRAAISRRLRESPPAFPPGIRDAALLGGALFDLLAVERGVEACVQLACQSEPAEPRSLLESAFGRPLEEVRPRWNEHLERLASPAVRQSR